MIHFKYLSKSEWKELGPGLMAKVFSGKQPEDDVPADFAILAFDGDVQFAFISCIRYANNTVCWQFGGNQIADDKRRILTALRMLISEMRDSGVEKILMYNRNTNTPILKIALHLGFITMGMRYVDGNLLLEQHLEV